ncbi:MAG: hypothetical protein F9B45_12500 [Phycisphaera sp. RhM]|nr:hypothetical protein [Phycisphaera sp. RhM]
MHGDVSRPGTVLADGPVETLDHLLPFDSEDEVITHGIYGTQRDTSHVNLSLEHGTGAFSHASFSSDTGSSTVNVLPWPSTLSTVISPP